MVPSTEGREEDGPEMSFAVRLCSSQAIFPIKASKMGTPWTKAQVPTSQHQLLIKLCPGLYLFICSNTRVLKQKWMEEFCLTLRSKKHFLRFQEKKNPTNQHIPDSSHALVPASSIQWCLQAVAPQLGHRRLFAVQENRAQTASLCCFVPACLHLGFPSVSQGKSNRKLHSAHRPFTRSSAQPYTYHRHEWTMPASEPCCCYSDP